MSAPLCTCCGKPRRERRSHPGLYTGAHGWCHTCYELWRKAGKPATGVPARMPDAERVRRVQAAYRARMAARLEDYRDLKRWGESDEMIARRLGVTLRTVRHYGRLLRAGMVLDEAARTERAA